MEFNKKKIRAYIESGINRGIWTPIFFIEFKNSEYLLVFAFYIYDYMRSFLLFIIFLIFYYKDLRLYSIIKDDIVEKIGIENYYWCIYIIIISILLFVIVLIVLIYKNNPKEEFKQIIKVFIYHRINFIINYNIYIKILGIKTEEFLEYNMLIIIIFIIYGIVQLICIYFKKEFELKLFHYLSWPLISIIFWIILYKITKYPSTFLGMYYRFIGYDNKYYYVYYSNDMENNDENTE